ncbi:hypothetical protein WOLCODRAFT_28746 [Wolfiporia cocos MD-104 SS10]|uniref:BTB domain-containing protein n=1 Tax=Wolfiporia cocos (strain MD-104) TaxID=742152 RepID=A0A2H3JAD7_WOLCO|nr:hypothetical protein WOLCODRAFT_28746 [Wolfiporia cocos MD-104 SS10]
MRRRGHAGGLRLLSLLAGGPRPLSLLAGGPRPPSLLAGSPLTASELALPMARSSTPIDVIQDIETRTSEQESPAADESKSARTRHSTFYMRDEMVVLDVDGCLYRVHRHILEHTSDFLRRLVASYANEDGVSGGTDDTAIPLPDIKPYQLDCLLHFLYHRVYDDNDDIPLADWATLLDVATRLGFSAVRARAIRALAVRRDALGAVETVALALAHGVPAWLASAYAALVRRPRPLDDTEADRLGARITARLAAAREAVRAAHWPPGDECAFDEEVVAKAVANAFWGGARGEDAGCDGIRQEGVKLRASVAVASLGLGET